MILVDTVTSCVCIVAHVETVLIVDTGSIKAKFEKQAEEAEMELLAQDAKLAYKFKSDA